VDGYEVEELAPGQLDLIRPLLVDLHLDEQRHYPDHPQFTRDQVEAQLAPVGSRFTGENVVLAVRDRDGHVMGFCWVILFDPGTGLEGEVAEVYVAEHHRGQGVGEALVGRAVRVFEERGVTLGYVWTRDANEPAVRLYQAAGFEPTRQLVLTWYPGDMGESGLPDGSI
jgi:ribosomal protein S18 acetylase RimI-like enzyme